MARRVFRNRSGEFLVFVPTSGEPWECFNKNFDLDFLKIPLAAGEWLFRTRETLLLSTCDKSLETSSFLCFDLIPSLQRTENIPCAAEKTVYSDHVGWNTLKTSIKSICSQIQFILLFSRQGKLRLQKWYTTLPDKERKKITREIIQIILSRGYRTSSFIDWKELKLVYKRYASLYFCCAVENQDNELLTLEIVHRYVELLDKYFGNVCELDIIFNFEKAYFILDEFIIGGEVQETSKKTAVKAIEESDMLQETMEEYMNKPTF
ncbi:AP-1 complex subunit sigma-3 [Erethizon dorsatum]